MRVLAPPTRVIVRKASPAPAGRIPGLATGRWRRTGA